MTSLLRHFSPVHQLLTDRDATYWALYWNLSDPNEENIFRIYPAYIASLIKTIQKSNAQRVFLVSKDRVHFLAGFLASLQIGIPIILPPSDAKGLLNELLLPGDTLMTDQEDLVSVHPNIILMKDIPLESLNDFKFGLVNPSEAFITFYTSGSTGKPKPVLKSLKQLENEIAVLEKMWGTESRGGAFFSTVPHHHIYGLLFSLLWPICGGYPLKRLTYSYWEDLLTQKSLGNYLISSPSHLGRFSGNVNESDVPDFKVIFSSGGELSFEAATVTKKYLGVMVTEVYGSTETGGVGYRQHHTKGQCWTKFPGIELLEGSNQRLCLKSPYLGNTIYQTEDRVSIESDEHFTLLGRADRIVKVEGKRVSLTEVAQRLTAFDYIREAVVINLEGEARDMLGAVLVLSPEVESRFSNLGKEKLIREIRKNLRLYLDPVVLPRKWRFVSEIPSNENGKFSCNLLRSFFGEGKA